MQTRLIGSTSYFSKAQLEATNFSRAEGIDAATEFKWRKTTGNLVKQAIKKLKLPDWVYETAMTYINRYFLTRSISKAERFSVVGGAVLLASKVQESPRAIYDIAFVLHELKNANKQQLGPDQRQVEKLMEDMVVAEQAMLFALNFNLVVETHVSLARRLLEPLDLWPKQQPALEEVEANQLKLFLFQAILRFLNDSALTNLSLQYPNQKVAAVALVMAAKRLAVRYTGKVMPSALQRAVVLANDAAWFEARGLTLEAAADIEAQISDLYATAPDPALAQRAKPSAPHQVALQQVPQQAPEQAAGAPAGATEAAGDAGAEEGEVPSAAAADAPAAASAPVPGSSKAAPAAVPSGLTSLGADGGASPSGLPAAAGARGSCQPGQPTSSAAVGPSDAGVVAGTPPLPPSHTPCHPSQQPSQRGKRVSDGDGCNGGDQQATSELHAAPEQQPDAAEPGERGDDRDAAGAYQGPEDSGNGNNSPNGLTNGNASGSGCGHAEGQPEVCSQQDAPRQPLPPSSQPQSPFAEALGASRDLAVSADRSRAKRGRSEEELVGCGAKVARLGGAGPVAMLH